MKISFLTRWNWRTRQASCANIFLSLNKVSLCPLVTKNCYRQNWQMSQEEKVVVFTHGTEWGLLDDWEWAVVDGEVSDVDAKEHEALQLGQIVMAQLQVEDDDRGLSLQNCHRLKRYTLWESQHTVRKMLTHFCWEYLMWIEITLVGW